jgi:hypothetical protein
MPYGYYQLVRFAARIGFAILAYTANEQGQKTEAIVYICLAILFQPLINLSLPGIKKDSPLTPAR